MPSNLLVRVCRKASLNETLHSLQLSFIALIATDRARRGQTTSNAQQLDVHEGH